jgi:hypothetical protein
LFVKSIKMQKICFVIFILLLFNFSLSGQSGKTISGTITDASSGEFLIGATVVVTSLGEGTTTNAYGFYSITISDRDSIGLYFRFIGYERQIKKLYLKEDIRLDVELSPGTNSLDEIIISSTLHEENVTNTKMSVIDIPTSKIRQLPVILGEADVLKIVQLLPGVQAGNEGTTGYFVRGGNLDQNLVQLDEATIYNPNHMIGLVSAFNTRAINNVTLIKGGFPSQYGGRLSSILDISMKEGNQKQFVTEGGIGLISSQMTVEGPIRKNQSSFIISGRRSYIDLLARPFLKNNIKTNYTFFDLNAKVNYKLGDNDRIFLSGFMSRDDAFYNQNGIEYNFLLNNKAATFRWNHIFSPQLFVNTSLIATSFGNDISAIQDNAFSHVISGINDLGVKTEFQYFPSQQHHILYGAHFTNHRFRSSGDAQVFTGNNQNEFLTIDSIPEKQFNELALYLNDDMKVTDYFSANLGFRIPVFMSDNIRYIRVEPRASLKFRLDKNTSIKGSYSMMNQFLHQIPSTTAAIPSDIWVPSTSQTKPQTSQQFALGLFKNFMDNSLETSFEIYYKTMKDQILFREGNQLISSLDVDDLLVYGTGWSYGAELFVQKSIGQFTGWASYTLSWTWQQFPELNYGDKFPFRHDRRHDLSIVGSYDFSDRWTFSGTFVYSSGSAYTLPVGRTYVSNGGSLFEGNYFIYEGRNNTRLKPYHRLNLSAIYQKERTLFGKTYESEWVFSIYNIYSRQNPYFVYFDIDPITEKPRAKQVSLLPIVPSVSFNFKF